MRSFSSTGTCAPLVLKSQPRLKATLRGSDATGQLLAAVSVRRGKTPVLDPTEARQLLDAIDVTTPVGLRDRALIGLMVFSFARIGAALGMKVEDVYVQNRRLWVRLHEKGGKVHEMPCHHTLEAYLDAYLDGCALRGDPKGPLFRTIERGRAVLTATPLPQANAYAMIGRRAAGGGIATKIGNHSARLLHALHGIGQLPRALLLGILRRRANLGCEVLQR